MNGLNELPTKITTTLVPEKERLAFIEKTFGIHFPLAIEPWAYSVTEKIAKDYDGGFWNFYSLSNSGFFMAPEGNKTYRVKSANYFEAEVSSEVLGIVVCETVYSHLSFARRKELARLCGRHYYLLREYVSTHEEAAVMFQLLD